jgi:hypothetical protein
MTGSAQAQPYYGGGIDNRYNSYESDYGMDNNYMKSYGNENGYESQYQSPYEPDYKPQYLSYGEDNRDKSKDSNSVSINKIKCNNINVNINNGQGTNNGNTTTNGNETNDGFKKINKDGFAFVCINNNNNIVVGGDGNEIIPPTPPTPPTPASLTVKKQVFGCDNIDEGGGLPTMDCSGLDNNSSEWLDCNNSIITNSIFCQSLPESIFDIEVLDDQNIQIQEFEGSTEGTTIQNLEPGTYTVNEIIHPQPPIDRLSVNAGIAQDCVNVGFDNGGELFNSTSNVNYIICLEYEDDCNTITLAAGEERTCTVKNYIRVGFDFSIT